MKEIKLRQDYVQEEVDELEKGYVQSTIELIKAPIFKKRIENDLEEELKTALSNGKDPEMEEIYKLRIKALKKALEQNELGEKSHRESIENLDLILPEVYKLQE